jgi:hypothetical protein
MNKSQQIRDYAAANPTAKARQIGEALGMKNAYVHSVLWALKEKGRVGKTEPKKTRPAPKKNYRVKLKNVAPHVPTQIEMFEPKSDPVNQPAHYKYGGIETIDFIEAKELGYNLGNVVKYITRADHKGNRKQDLEKAIWYLKRELDHYM